MNTPMYNDDPAREIQRAILDTHHVGATHAAVAIRRNHATVEDNRHGDDHPPHQVAVNTRIHPSQYRHEWLQQLACCIAPEGTTVWLHDHTYDRVRRSPMRSVNDRVLQWSRLPQSGYHMYLTTADHAAPITIIDADGASRTARFDNYHGMGGYHHTDTDRPGALVHETNLASVVIIDPQRPSPELLEIQKHTLLMAAAHIARTARNSPGLA